MDDNEDYLPEHKRTGYAERVAEVADRRRKELREEGAHCDNCKQLGDNPGYHCEFSQQRPVNNVCAAWRLGIR